jgi:hypothetical protein
VVFEIKREYQAVRAFRRERRLADRVLRTDGGVTVWSGPPVERDFLVSMADGPTRR